MVSENPYFFYSFYGGVGSPRHPHPDQATQVDGEEVQTTQDSSSVGVRNSVEESTTEPANIKDIPEV